MFKKRVPITNQPVPSVPTKPANTKKRSLFLNETTEDVPREPYVYYRDIHNAPTLVHRDLPTDEKEIRCYYCGTYHDVETSLPIPHRIYQKTLEDGSYLYTFEGEGYYHSFECAYRVVLNHLPKNSQTYPHIYGISEIYLKIFHQLVYPNERLLPAPSFQDMGLDWKPAHRYRRLSNVVLSRMAKTHDVQIRDEKKPEK